MAIWPETLPQDLIVEDFRESEPDAVIASPVDAGPVRRRPRYTAVPKHYEGSIVVERAQLATFRAFYEQVINRVEPFDWQDPIDGAPVRMAFRHPDAYQIAPEGGGWFRITMKLEAQV